MSEFKFDLERSEYFKDRLKLLKLNTVPKLSEAKKNLGDDLANVLFDRCDNALREYFGLKAPLKGPGSDLWVSPSDLLIGKLALKPPFTPKCLQALTHKGILEIGEGLENKFRQEMELDKQRTLEKYKSDLLATIEDKMKAEIKDVEIRERLLCNLEMERQRQEYEVALKKELSKLEKEITERYNEALRSNEERLKEKWEEVLQTKIQKTVEEMTKLFLKQLEKQEEMLMGHFEMELRKNEILKDYETKLFNQKTTDALRRLKHHQECTNLVNLMYVICSERRTCCDQKRKLEEHFARKMSDLQEIIRQKDEDIRLLTQEKDKQIREVSLRETCLLKIIEYFQKFINFALRSAPKQAEFLLSVEKMMTFELTNALVRAEVPKNYPCETIIPWKEEISRESSRVSNIEVEDFHNCFEEVNPPVADESEELPSIRYKNKLYVREDFRDMLRGNVEITPSNDLWNKDVEILVNTWRELSVQEKASMPTVSSEKVFRVDSDEQEENWRSDRSKQSVVQFIEWDNSSTKRRSTMESKKLLSRSSLKPSSFPIVEEIQLEMPRTKSQLLATRDSLELLLEKKRASVSPVVLSQTVEMEPTEYPSKELVVETRDSILLRKTSLAKKASSAEFNTSPVDSVELKKASLEKANVRSKTSRLTSARNSIELLKESLMKLREPAALFCQKKDQAASNLALTGTCCERCKRREDNLSTQYDNEQMLELKLLKRESDSDEKSVKISHIEVINLDDGFTSTSNVSFKTVPTIFKEVILEKKRPKRKRIEKKTPKPKPIYKIEVVGDENAREGDQSVEEFTGERINSLISLMKDHPKLINLFTAGTR